MDIDKLMKNDELSNSATRTSFCKKGNDQNICYCDQCIYSNSIINSKETNDDKSNVTSISMNENLQTKKSLNPITTIKNLISNQSSINNQKKSIKNNQLSNCLNHNKINNLNKLSENEEIKQNEINLDRNQHDDDINNLNKWFTHCHYNETKDDSKSESANRRLIITTILCGIFLILELVGGYVANSLSIMTDAAHLLSDIVSFSLSLLAVYLSKKKPTKRFTFGYQRAEILGAVCSILLIWLLTAVVVYFAIQRVITMDFEIESTVMMVVALFGIGVNILMGITLHGCMCPGFGCFKSNSLDDDEKDENNHNFQQNFNDKNFTSYHFKNNVNDKYNIELEVVSEDVSEKGINLNKIDAQNNMINLKQKSNGHNHKNSHGHGHSHGHNHGHKHGHSHEQENINIRAAIIHVLGDLIQSIGVFIAALIIYFKPEWKIADPICTFLFSIIVLFTTIRIMKESILIIMESAPDNIDHTEVKLSLLDINGVKMVHNLYIWQLTVDNVVAVGHLVISPNFNIEQVLQKARILLKEKHNITQITLQCERYQPQIMLTCDSCNDL